LERQIEEKKNIDLIKSGRNFLGILNDLKRRPEDAARELGISKEEIIAILSGEKEISSDIVTKASKIWPVNARDFYIIHDDCVKGVKVMTSAESEKSRRVMERGGKPYYEYRDTAMSRTAPFRPEWIMELCYVENNDPNNSKAQWNNGHFMHQFTYFIGEVNFYYKNAQGENQVAVMNTGDSMYITPFVPHTFTTRQGSNENGLILALTYGNKLTGDVQQEITSISTDLGSEFALDFSTKESAFGAILKFNREISNLSLEELSRRTGIEKLKIEEIESGKKITSDSELKIIAEALGVNMRDLMSNDKIEDKVIVKYHKYCKKWKFPESTQIYEFRELASSTAIPFSKAFEVAVKKSDNSDMDLRAGLHQYVYNVGETNVSINWVLNKDNYQEVLHPGDSAYVKPFVSHNFRGEGKLLILRVGGKIVGDSQRELSNLGKDSVKRAISETMQWYDPKDKN